MKLQEKYKYVTTLLSESCKISSNISLADYTTFRTGGLADLMLEPSDEKSAAKAIYVLSQKKIPFTIIGGGSNLLISDKGLRGVVIKISKNNLEIAYAKKEIYASAFMQKEDFIKQVVSSGYGGVEFMAGIPGTIGGGIFMNAGTYMNTFAEILKKIKIALPNDEISEIEIKPEISTYRKIKIPQNSLILGGYFSLPLSDDREKTKKDIDSIVKDRHQKHPMEYPSAGSVFKNPEGHSSWKLINDSGLKGFAIGGAIISEKHTNFIVNTGNATSKDIYKLITYIQKIVKEKFGVILETEIKILGDFQNAIK